MNLKRDRTESGVATASAEVASWQRLIASASFFHNCALLGATGHHLGAPECAYLLDLSRTIAEQVAALATARPVFSVSNLQQDRKKRKSETGSKEVFCDILTGKLDPAWTTDKSLPIITSSLPDDQELYFVYKGPPVKVHAFARDDGLSWKARFKLAGKGITGISYDCRSAEHGHLKKHVWIALPKKAELAETASIATAADGAREVSERISPVHVPMDGPVGTCHEEAECRNAESETETESRKIKHEPVSDLSQATEGHSLAQGGGDVMWTRKRERNYGDLEQCVVEIMVIAYLSGTPRGLPVLFEVGAPEPLSTGQCDCICGGCSHKRVEQRTHNPSHERVLRAPASLTRDESTTSTRVKPYAVSKLLWKDRRYDPLPLTRSFQSRPVPAMFAAFLDEWSNSSLGQQPSEESLTIWPRPADVSMPFKPMLAQGHAPLVAPPQPALQYAPLQPLPGPYDQRLSPLDVQQQSMFPISLQQHMQQPVQQPTMVQLHQMPQMEFPELIPLEQMAFPPNAMMLFPMQPMAFTIPQDLPPIVSANQHSMPMQFPPPQHHYNQ